ncbi:DUF2254 domain-containing protein [Skermanella mucosa]|uniref:DUF2254 domain-containing protein n=1 Tax=Skermanella mucosa TaxID=1789672 RepID=UPI00192B9C58|nr:DUF2254 domain-containing protein [Skermanella mucosa]UEM19803.1 DUF2254 domain-containing protein [Skermanella mucosa]
MRERVRYYLDWLRTSLWFIPLLMGVVAVAFAILLLTWGADVPDDMVEYWLLYAGDTENARELVSTLLSGMITMFSLVVSITMVVLTLAAGQIGPRLIRNFIQDRQTQAVLGLFLADILYLIIVFRTIDGDRMDSVPHLAVTTGTALTVLCLFVLLFFVHKLARSIIYDNVVRNVAGDLMEVTKLLLPEKSEARPDIPRPTHDFVWVPLGRDGYLQSIDLEALVEAASENDALIRLEVRPGHYILGRGRHVALHSTAAGTDETCRKIRDAFILGSERTPTQDIEYGIRQLVEMATRALSPGINDVFTALAVIDSLSSSLGHIFERDLEPAVLLDDSGRPRVVRDIAGYDSIVGAAFDQIRQAGSGHAAVLIRLTEAIGSLAPYVRSDEQRQPLLEQLDMIRRSADDNISVPRDLTALHSSGSRTRELLMSLPKKDVRPC